MTRCSRSILDGDNSTPKLKRRRADRLPRPPQPRPYMGTKVQRQRRPANRGSRSALPVSPRLTDRPREAARHWDLRSVFPCRSRRGFPLTKNPPLKREGSSVEKLKVSRTGPGHTSGSKLRQGVNSISVFKASMGTRAGRGRITAQAWSQRDAGACAPSVACACVAASCGDEGGEVPSSARGRRWTPRERSSSGRRRQGETGPDLLRNRWRQLSSAFEFTPNSGLLAPIVSTLPP